MKIVCNTILASVFLALLGCDAADPASKSASTGSAPSKLAAGEKDRLSGKWSLHRGKAVDTLVLTNNNGVLKGTLTEDPQWGARSWPIHGMNVGAKVTFFYSTAKTNETTAVTADFSLEGTLEDRKMSGEYKLRLISTMLSSGRSTPLSSEHLWIATKQ